MDLSSRGFRNNIGQSAEWEVRRTDNGFSNGTEATPPRDALFISHANPEDDQFTLWLGLKLANEGYAVWSDLTKLLGGEAFWDDAEKAIRERAIKFLFVLSKSSNAKDGPLQELHVARAVAKDHGLHDFVIPLHVDDLPYGDVHILLNRLNNVPFHASWALGLDQLLKKLKQDGVPKNPDFSPNAVNQWWRTKFSSRTEINSQPEVCLSNWFPITDLPEVYFHKLSRYGIGKIQIPESLPFPAFQHEDSLVTFAKATDFSESLGTQIYIERSSPYSVLDLLVDRSRRFGPLLVRLLKLGWDQMVHARGLTVYQFSNGSCFYFERDRIPGNIAYFSQIDGRESHRAVVGIKSRKDLLSGLSRIRHWHFGIQARPAIYPSLSYLVKGHVLFSDDGNSIWKSKARLHSARRNQCKDWWNDDWRDRCLAAMSWLAEQNSSYIKITLGTDVFMKVAKTPLCFESPLSYQDPKDRVMPLEESAFELEDQVADEDEQEEAERKVEAEEVQGACEQSETPGQRSKAAKAG